MVGKTTLTPESNDFNYYLKKIMRIIAIIMSGFHMLTAGIGALPTMQQRCLHVGLALILIFMQSIIKDENKKLNKIISFFLLISSAVVTIYVFMNWYGMAMRVAFPMQIDIILGGIAVFAVMEATRRKLGWALPIMVSVFILYALLGQYLPPSVGHKGYSLSRVIGFLFMETSGIYGKVTGISATYIFLFVLFGAFLENSGASVFFIDLASSLFGKTKGGSAKVATISSCLFGMVSGSAVANVMAIGPLTVPMMTKVGYSKRFSGAITSVAGTGGQFMPPIMGAAAFIIAETLGVPYLKVALSALIPGILYYMAIIFIIDLRSNRMGIQGLKEVPNCKKVLKEGFYLAIPIILLIYFLTVAAWSPIKAGFWSIISLALVSWVKKDTRMGIKKILKAFEVGAYNALEVAIICTLAGIMIGMLSLTGLGLKFSSLLITISGGSQPVLLFLTMIAALILGMGMTTTSVYIILSVLVAPALTKMGIPVLSAHLFVFYFGILSAITPPVATASFAAASVAKDNPMKLGIEAWRVGLSGYILPFMFIYSKELLMQGKAISIIGAVITSIIGIYALSVALEGYFKFKVPIIFRIMLFGAALCLMISDMATDILGIAICLVIMIPQLIKSKKRNIAIEVKSCQN